MNLARLKQARKHSGLTLTDVAERLGVSPSAPGQWERGEKSPKLDRLERLADLYHVSVSYLLGEDAPQSQNGFESGELLSDPGLALGLRELAENGQLVETLAINPAEWAALRSLNPPRLLSANAYLAILMVLRGA